MPPDPRINNSGAFFIPAPAPVGKLLSAVFDLAPPPFVVPVPTDGGTQALLEIYFGVPPERMHLAAVKRVAAIMARSIGHPTDGALVEAEFV